MYYTIHPIKMYNSAVLVYSQFYNQYHHLILEHFYHPQKKPCTH